MRRLSWNHHYNCCLSIRKWHTQKDVERLDFPRLGLVLWSRYLPYRKRGKVWKNCRILSRRTWQTKEKTEPWKIEMFGEGLVIVGICLPYGFSD